MVVVLTTVVVMTWYNWWCVGVAGFGGCKAAVGCVVPWSLVLVLVTIKKQVVVAFTMVLLC